MTPERWEQVKKLLADALEKAPEERRAYLDRACTEPELRREVESLIAAHEQEGPSLAGDFPASVRTALENGTRIGPYEVRAQLGAGGMGVVYRAWDARLERDVAIKVLPPGVLADEAARRRFRKEALALAKLNHPNIAAVYDVGQVDGTDYLVMECVTGQSIAEKLKSGPLEEMDVTSLGAQVAAALEEAHEHGIVHRDLKPANIIVTPKGTAKVLDFGLAKLVGPKDSEATLSLAETKGLVGTILYMSPEQAEGKEVDSRSDLWSLGVVLYESMAGKAPFDGGSAVAVLHAIVHERPKPLHESRPGTSEDLDHIISHAMERDVSRRYQSAAEMSQDLSSALTRRSAPNVALMSKKRHCRERMPSSECCSRF